MNIYLTNLAVFIFLAVPTILFGAEDDVLRYVSMVTLPGGFDTGTASLSDLFNALYLLSISIAALLAVIKIIIAGFKYSLSDVVTNKSEAISDIQGALFGLILIISAVLIISVINPTIVGLNT